MMQTSSITSIQGLRMNAAAGVVVISATSTAEAKTSLDCRSTNDLPVGVF